MHHFAPSKQIVHHPFLNGVEWDNLHTRPLRMLGGDVRPLLPVRPEPKHIGTFKGHRLAQAERRAAMSYAAKAAGLIACLCVMGAIYLGDAL